MSTFDKIVAKLALPMVLATFVVVPAAVWLYDGLYIPSQYPEDAKVFTLYWRGEQGITLRRVNGHNYWRSGFKRVEEIEVNEGDEVIFRLISADVHHGFALPAFGITDPVIRPGDVTEVRFIADKVGSFEFFCTIRCGSTHDNMEAVLKVLPADGGEMPD